MIRTARRPDHAYAPARRPTAGCRPRARAPPPRRPRPPRRRQRPRRPRPPTRRRTTPTRRRRSLRPTRRPAQPAAPGHHSGALGSRHHFAPGRGHSHELALDRVRSVHRRRHARRAGDRGGGLPRGPQAGLEAGYRLRTRARRQTLLGPDHALLARGGCRTRWWSRWSTSRLARSAPCHPRCWCWARWTSSAASCCCGPTGALSRAAASADGGGGQPQ